MTTPATETVLTTSEAKCRIHGVFASTNVDATGRYPFWTNCPQCEADRIETERRENEREAEYQLQKRIAVSGLTPRFVRCTFENFDASTEAQRTALNSCRAMVAKLELNTGSGLWLVGPPGTGKTHLASAMINHVIRQRGGYAAIHSAREIVRQMRASWGRKDGEREEEVLNRFGDLHLLVIDEVGVGFGSDSEMVQLFDVIDLRYRHERPTIIVSNLSAKEIKPAIGDAAYDRLREGSALVPCNWESHRASGSRA